MAWQLLNVDQPRQIVVMDDLTNHQAVHGGLRVGSANSAQ